MLTFAGKTRAGRRPRGNALSPQRALCQAAVKPRPSGRGDKARLTLCAPVAGADAEGAAATAALNRFWQTCAPPSSARARRPCAGRAGGWCGTWWNRAGLFQAAAGGVCQTKPKGAAFIRQRQGAGIKRAMPALLTEAVSERLFSLQRVAFQTIRSAVSRKRRGFSAHAGPGGAVPPSRVLPFLKAERSIKCGT